MDRHWNIYQKSYECLRCQKNWSVVAVGETSTNLSACSICQTLLHPVAVGISSLEILSLCVIHFMIKNVFYFVSDYPVPAMKAESMDSNIFFVKLSIDWLNKYINDADEKQYIPFN